MFFTEASSNAKHNQESSTLLLKPPPNVSLLFNQFNDLLAESNRANRKNVINCNNYDIDYIQKIKTNSSSLSLFHLNILTPVLLMRTLMTLNICSKPEIRPFV